MISSTSSVYLALALTWGASFLLMKIAVEGFSPAQVALGRILIGAATLAVVMLASRRRWPRDGRLWAHMTVVACFLCVVPFLLFALAAAQLPSGLSAILNSTTPIWTALGTSIAIRNVRLTSGQIVGMLLGFAGVAVIMGAWQILTDESFLASVPAQLACLAATASYGVAFTWLQRFVLGRHSADPVALAAVQLVAAAAISVVVAPFIALTSPDPTLGSGLSLVTLGVLGTGFAYIWNTRVVTAWGSLAAATVTYLTPVVGVALGVWLLGERFSWHEPVGGVIVVASVMLVQRRFDPLFARYGPASTTRP